MPKNHKNSEVSLNQLAGKIDNLANILGKKIDEVGNSVEELAQMTARGFDGVKSDIGAEITKFKLETHGRFNRLENRFEKEEDERFDLVNEDEKNRHEVSKLRKRVNVLETKVFAGK